MNMNIFSILNRHTINRITMEIPNKASFYPARLIYHINRPVFVYPGRSTPRNWIDAETIVSENCACGRRRRCVQTKGAPTAPPPPGGSGLVRGMRRWRLEMSLLYGREDSVLMKGWIFRDFPYVGGSKIIQWFKLIICLTICLVLNVLI